ncbi:conserved hypothetical protein [Chloroherpeton thalassium ATCC 35110]|uniref:Uncharacterized protein n=1 Tax=Chloroherpeton thalassium (strain ATCC 35110 / GB-78) TaxID=517418 RepID=B3QY98_CHLT3|nr:hypothetical protein [Chloroherpeton thalassium]ACF15064.1 conserved hypothetical protein [Chloroherpeton thalassium ATCC 35110]
MINEAQALRMNPILAHFNTVYNRLEHFWEHKNTERAIANISILVFLGTIFMIELGRHGFLPDSISRLLPKSHYYGVSLAFTLLLVVEIFGLIFGIANSVADAVGKQFEILSLILLRQSFKEFVHFKEPLDWAQASIPVLHILSDAAGGLIVFLLLGWYYHIQRHTTIVAEPSDKVNFIAAKKMVSLLLMMSFAIIGIQDLIKYINHEPTFDFFSTFYTVLVFSDVLLVLISLRYSASYQIVFRNSGFAVATVLIRLALTAPPYINVGLGLGAILFAIGTTYAYNIFENNQLERSQIEAPHGKRIDEVKQTTP